jgi:hypothetical protein
MTRRRWGKEERRKKKVDPAKVHVCSKWQKLLGLEEG